MGRQTSERDVGQAACVAVVRQLVIALLVACVAMLASVPSVLAAPGRSAGRTAAVGRPVADTSGGSVSSSAIRLLGALSSYARATSVLAAPGVAGFPEETAPDVKFTPTPGEISGTVTDASKPGTPLQGIEVDVLTGDVSAGDGQVVVSACTAADGTYTFSGLAPGTYAVAFAYGNKACALSDVYALQYYQGIPAVAPDDPTPSSTPTAVTVNGGLDTPNIDAAMIPFGSIVGKVTDVSDGQPVGNIQVTVYDLSGTPQLHGCTQTDGTYTIGNLPAGGYIVAFGLNPCAGSSNYVAQYYNGEPGGAATFGAATAVTVAGMSQTPGIDAALVPFGTVTGTVTDASSHAAVANIEVDAFDPSGNFVTDACTAADGSYTLHAPAGGYEIQFEGSSAFPSACTQTAGDYVPQYFKDAPSLAGAQTVMVTDEVNTPNINAALVPFGTLSGTVTDATSLAGVASIEVDAFDSSGNFVSDACTGGDGTYTLHLPPGGYKVEFEGNVAAPSACSQRLTDYVSQFYNDVGTLGAATTVPVSSAPPTSGIDAALIPSAKISGTITDASSNLPIAAVGVTAFDGNGNVVATTCTSADGTYTLPLAVGSYRLGFATAAGRQACNAQYYVTQYSGGGTLLSGATVLKVTSGDLTEDATLTFGGQITGGVQSGATLLPNVEVDAFDADHADTFVAATCTGANGGYTLVVPKGNYKIGFTSDAGGASCSGSTAGYLPQFYSGAVSLKSATHVPVAAGATVSSISGNLVAAADISGTVTDPLSGGPAANVEVDALFGDGSVAFATCTAADGTYTLAVQAGGEYRIGFATGLGAASCGKSNSYLVQYYKDTTSFLGATLVTGPATGVDAALVTPGYIAGTVTDTSGTALGKIDVEAFDSSGTVVASTCTAANGTYTLSVAPDSGGYRVGFATGLGSVSCGGPAGAYVPQYYRGAPSLADASPVTVSATQTTSPVDATLTGTGKLSGTVTDAASGSPLAGIEVDAITPSGVLVAATCTASDGTYTFRLTAGTGYDVGFATDLSSTSCSATDASYLPQYYSGAGSQAGAAIVQVSAGVTATANASMTAGGEISGTVTDAASGRPLANVEVDVFDASGGEVRVTCTRTDGTYLATRLAAGNDDRVAFAADGNAQCGPSAPAGYAAQYYQGQSSLASANPVSVSAGANTTGINAALAPPPPTTTVTSTTPAVTPSPAGGASSPTGGATSPTITTASKLSIGALRLLSKSHLTLSGTDVARIVLGCIGSGACTGKATLTVKEKTKPRKRGKHAKLRARGRRATLETRRKQTDSKTVVLGSAAIAVAGGRRATVKIKLNRTGRRLLATGHGTLAVVLSLKGRATQTAFSLRKAVRLKQATR